MSTTQTNDQMISLNLFTDILMELSTKDREGRSMYNPRHKLRFVNQSIIPYEDIELSLIEYLKSNLTVEQFQSVELRLADLVDECRICELLYELIEHSETTMDRHVALFDEMLELIFKIRDMEYDGSSFKEMAIDKCALLIYDSFAVLRSMRKKLMEISRTYHVPYFYDTSEGSIRLRSSVLTTYKNICTVIDDFSILNETLWYVRHYNYFSNGIIQ
ncbi:hypothetical protein RDWZM_002594 [Blomia tropicalis]|uniref:Uncharacterized protein n=1 Tax=Blomia tropicalis TaxID=40697 RepID=A0A9Q0RRQ1_BLOTA|nr:hypothetical protein RDWZM_002594 [Blomia tropicalis]